MVMACAHNMMMKLKHIREQEEMRNKITRKTTTFADESYVFILIFFVLFVFVT